MPNSWITALKKYNENKGGGSWCVPRKGSPQHAEVKKLMSGGSPTVKKMSQRTQMQQYNQLMKMNPSGAV